MYDTMVVEVCDGGECGTDEVGGIRLIVGAFATNAIEELASKSKISDEVYYDMLGWCL
jgi:hypothetical protein